MRAGVTHFTAHVAFVAGLADGLVLAGASLETAGLALGAGRGLMASRSVDFLCNRKLELVFLTSKKERDVL
jgi:hypothetical protein